MKQLTEAKVYSLVFGNVISALREKRGLTQRELVDRVNEGTDADALLTQSTLSRIEAGLARPDTVVLRRIADALSMTASELTKVVDEAEERARNTATTVVSGGHNATWYAATASAAGAAGLLGLIGFSVAATVGPAVGVGAALAAGARLINSSRKGRKK